MCRGPRGQGVPRRRRRWAGQRGAGNGAGFARAWGTETRLRDATAETPGGARALTRGCLGAWRHGGTAFRITQRARSGPLPRRHPAARPGPVPRPWDWGRTPTPRGPPPCMAPRRAAAGGAGRAAGPAPTPEGRRAPRMVRGAGPPHDTGGAGMACLPPYRTTSGNAWRSAKRLGRRPGRIPLHIPSGCPDQSVMPGALRSVPAVPRATPHTASFRRGHGPGSRSDVAGVRDAAGGDAL